ncbi:MAG: hypothetical protein VXV89_06355, partial [Candidatus Thermoplasmatota archaeon]|nr:hypothetical protein [Candidatus Thermoplasmatota archaeon]
GLDPENRDDGGYATFGIVRDGMSHVRAIAEVPTSDDPTGTNLDNPFSTAGRPLYEVKINTIEMIGIADPDGELSGKGLVEESGSGVGTAIIALLLMSIAAGVAYFVYQNNSQEEEKIYEAELLDENDASSTT